jgi:hypothetical protein
MPYTYARSMPAEAHSGVWRPLPAMAAAMRMQQHSARAARLQVHASDAAGEPGLRKAQSQRWHEFCCVRQVC